MASMAHSFSVAVSQLLHNLIELGVCTEPACPNAFHAFSTSEFASLFGGDQHDGQHLSAQVGSLSPVRPLELDVMTNALTCEVYPLGEMGRWLSSSPAQLRPALVDYVDGLFSSVSREFGVSLETLLCGLVLLERMQKENLLAYQRAQQEERKRQRLAGATTATTNTTSVHSTCSSSSLSSSVRTGSAEATPRALLLQSLGATSSVCSGSGCAVCDGAPSSLASLPVPIPVNSRHHHHHHRHRYGGATLVMSEGSAATSLRVSCSPVSPSMTVGPLGDGEGSAGVQEGGGDVCAGEKRQQVTTTVAASQPTAVTKTSPLVDSPLCTAVAASAPVRVARKAMLTSADAVCSNSFGSRSCGGGSRSHRHHTHEATHDAPAMPPLCAVCAGTSLFAVQYHNVQLFLAACLLLSVKINEPALSTVPDDELDARFAKLSGCTLLPLRVAERTVCEALQGKLSTSGPQVERLLRRLGAVEV